MTATTSPRSYRPDIDRGARRGGEFVFVMPLGFVVATVLVTALLPASAGVSALSLIACLFGVFASLRRGGPFLTPSGVFYLAVGVFVGGGAYYLSFVDTPVNTASLRDATALALLSCIAISMMVTVLSIRRQLAWPSKSAVSRMERSFRPPPQFAWKGVLLLAVSQIPVISRILGPFASAMGVAGVIILVLWAASRRFHMHWFGDAPLVALTFGLPYLWIELSFTGGGRLMVAGISIAAFVGWNLMIPSRTQKVLLICCIPLFLAFAGLNRLSEGHDSGTSASSVVSSGEGLASVYNPLETFTRMIQPLTPEQSHKLGPRYGATFLNTLYLPIPHQMWEGKPKGFGAELTEIFEPEKVVDKHSMAGLLQGEWYANFGYAGLFLMIPTTGWFLVLLDKRHARLALAGIQTPRAWWQAAVLLCIVSSIADLLWVGTFMLVARGGLAAIVVALVGTVSLTRRGSRGSPPPPGGAPDWPDGAELSAVT